MPSNDEPTKTPPPPSPTFSQAVVALAQAHRGDDDEK